MVWVVCGVCGVVFLAAVVLWTAPRWAVAWIAARAPGCVYAVRTPDRVVALTIDDGPDGITTPAILNVLRAHDAHATFFLISSRVAGNETTVRALVADGHELGNHMTHDEPSVCLTPTAFHAALREAGDVIGRFGPVQWFRPGSGWYTRRMVAAVEQAGYRCALGSVYPFDPHVRSSAFAAAYVLANARPGAVIVLHDGGGRGRRTARTLQRVLPALRARGYRIVTLSDLVRVGTIAVAVGTVTSSCVR
jgi:peptidoglycan/xylan/chitin deacetylase (PgdA/CDA1 family)